MKKVAVLGLGLVSGFTAAMFALPEAKGAADASAYSQLDLFSDAFERVRANYVRPVKDGELIDAAIQGMVSNLDPHSSYMDAKNYGDMQITTKGQFGGVGIEVTQDVADGMIKVISPIDGTPASRAGIKTNDRIAGIDGSSIAGLPLNEAIDKMRGPAGSKITLTILREGEKKPFDVTLVRAIVSVDAATYRREGDIGYIRMPGFNEQTADGLEKAVRDLKKQIGPGIKGYVLDLRNNPGGLLDQAVAVSNDFLDSGGIVSIKGRQPQDNRTYNAQADKDVARGLPVVVLINGGSASASEIVAGALHDDHRAVLLGTRSFGKGSVQTVLPVRESGGAIRLTTALYFTPSGRSIQALGIEPDVVVQPAKIEKVETGPQTREADLRGALHNEQVAPAKIVPAKPAANVPPGTTPVPRPEANALDSNTLGTDQDYQFVRAIDLLRGVSLFKTLAAQ
jgi:carboxyl-terminal processing protease